MARKRLTEVQWASIRKRWEYDPDEPTYLQAGERAGQEFGFDCPAKATLSERATAEKWERRGSLNGINAAAQRKADRLAEPNGSERQPNGKANASGSKKAKAPSDADAALSSRAEAEDKRAAVLARHRSEWLQVAQLRQEALVKRPHVKDGVSVGGDVAKAFEAAKLAKITAEMTLIQQTGERKAWGLDVVVDADQLKNLSDEDLRALAEGKAPRRS